MFRLDKKKIFFLYRYYLLERDFFDINKEIIDKKRSNWFVNCLEKEKEIKNKISKKLKINWNFDRIFPLERAILAYGCYEIENYNIYSKIIIDQIVNFSKVYLDESKYKYINKILHLIFKDILESK